MVERFADEEPCLHVETYKRTADQLAAMGHSGHGGENLGHGEGDLGAERNADEVRELPSRLDVSRDWNFALPIEENLRLADSVEGQESELCIFNGPCGSCGATASNKVCPVRIPGFKECVIMSFTCETCGARDTELKPSGAIGDLGCRLTLTATTLSDLNREVLKSDFAAVSIPDAHIDLCPGTLGGVFTTVEGLLTKIEEELRKVEPFVGDSANPEKRAAFVDRIDKLRQLASGAILPFTLIVEDPADQSFIGGPATEENVDALLTIERFERTDEQNEDLGLNDMRVVDY
eukprot:Polyplicarium_translucidae@DN2856_c0_g1_i1.p2